MPPTLKSFSSIVLAMRWADDPGIGSRMINARSETAAEKPSFRRAFKERRC
jgi:putative SOS response-associated peptidase YedK